MDIFRRQLLKHEYEQTNFLHQNHYVNDFGPWTHDSLKKQTLSYFPEKQMGQKIRGKIFAGGSKSNNKYNLTVKHMGIEKPSIQKLLDQNEGMQRNTLPEKYYFKQKPSSKSYRSQEKFKNSYRTLESNQTIQWRPLTTTTYIHDHDKLPSFIRKEVPFELGQQKKRSLNLQRMLKIKEKIRMKNNQYIHKIRSNTNDSKELFSCENGSLREGPLEERANTTMNISEKRNQIRHLKQKIAMKTKYS